MVECSVYKNCVYVIGWKIGVDYNRVCDYVYKGWFKIGEYW